MNEFITEFFATIVEQSSGSDLIKPYQKDIFELFNSDLFFQNSMINLKQWHNIIKHCIDKKPEEILQEQMQAWNAQGGIFANQAAINNAKCYAMKRIAFLIFSCEDDDF